MTGIAANTLVVTAPVQDGAGGTLEAALAALESAERSPFAEIAGTHFARWVLLRGLPGPVQGLLRETGYYLVLCADFDPPVGDWVAALCGQPLLAATMRCWDGFPGTDDAAAVAAFLHRYNTAPGFTVQGYRGAAVDEVRAALELRRGLRELAARAQSERLEPAALRAAWEGLVAP